MGLKQPRTRRHGRVSGGVTSISRPAPARRRLEHPLAHFAMGAGFSVLLAVILLPPGWTFRHLLGTLLLVGVLNALFFLYLLSFRREILTSRAMVSLVLILATVVLGVAVLWTPTWPPYLIPVTVATIVLAVVFSRRFALETSWMLLLYVGAILLIDGRTPPADVVRTMIVLSAGMMAAVLATGRIRTRSKIIHVGLLIGAIHVAVIAALFLATPGGAAGGGRTPLEHLFWGLAHGVLVGFVVSGSLPLIEYLFRISTDISLLELANISQQTVLRRLLLAAPGTYNHSFIVGMLAEEAAEAIGANPLLARVGGYYHDIGKMLKPPYFGENEAIPGQHHRPLAPTMSTLVIKAHVKDGVELARYHDLPRPIVDIIEQHHGTTCVEYFYEEARKRAKKGERVEDSLFRYEGPKPRTKEAGIVMLADSVEAATRSLSDPTPARIDSTIRKISVKKLEDSQLDECGLTLSEVRRIEDSFIRVLAGIFHRRPRYPEIVGTRPGPEDPDEAQRVDYFTAT
jgi:putative nucleotidyltransferase with HDIG domain